MSEMMVWRLVKVTLWPALTMSWTQTRAVLNLSGTKEVSYDPIWAISSTGSVSILPYAGWCGADIVGPWGAKEEASRDCGHHGAGVDNCVGVVWADADFVGLGASIVVVVGSVLGMMVGMR